MAASMAALLFLIILYGALFLFSIADYVLSSLGLYGIAKKRDISLAGLAWLPIGNLWVLGSIIDSYEEYKKDHFKKWHILLPVLSAVVIVAYVLIYVLYFVMYFAMFGTMVAEANVEELPEAAMGTFIIFMIIILLLVVVLSLIMVAMQALNSIAIYKTFESIAPKKAIKYLILSLILPLAEGICMLKCKKIMPQRTPFDDVSKDDPVDNYRFDDTVQLTQPTEEAPVSNESDPNNLV